jgi:hypothetical protein
LPRNGGVFLAILSLIAQAWLPAEHAAALPQSKTASYARAVEFFGASFALCSEQNWEVQGGKGWPTHMPPSKAAFCAICQAVQSVASLTPPPPVIAVMDARRVVERLVPSRGPAIARGVYAIPQSRAPPVTV